jgi:hypothetical protein
LASLDLLHELLDVTWAEDGELAGLLAAIRCLSSSLRCDQGSRSHLFYLIVEGFFKSFVANSMKIRRRGSRIGVPEIQKNQKSK